MKRIDANPVNKRSATVSGCQVRDHFGRAPSRQLRLTGIVFFCFSETVNLFQVIITTNTFNISTYCSRRFSYLQKRVLILTSKKQFDDRVLTKPERVRHLTEFHSAATVYANSRLCISVSMFWNTVFRITFRQLATMTSFRCGSKLKTVSLLIINSATQ
jgi:hypothetical protein